MASTYTQQHVIFFPKADAAVLSRKSAPDYPQTVGPIFDSNNVNIPAPPWPLDGEKTYYPVADDVFAPAPIPDQSCCGENRYLRAPLAKNERFRLSMVWYYTREIFKETEFLAGLQEKVCIAQESTGWDFSIIGILDVAHYTRLATVGLPLGILPRGETICAHTVARPPASVFLLPNMMEDWRFAQSPYVEYGGLIAYAGAPLRVQNEHGQTACLGTICVASPTPQASLPRPQQAAMARLADWVVSDIVNLTRTRRQRVRSRMVDLIATAQAETKDALSEQPALRALQTIYPGTVIGLQSAKAGHVEVEGRDPVPLSDISSGLWEDFEHIDRFIAESNHLEPPTDRVVRVIAAQCESVSGQSLLTVGTKDFRLVFDDIDAWFIQTCASIISDMWHKRLLAEVMFTKEKFLRGFCHQLRTPIHGILGSVELLAEEFKLQKLEEAASQAIALQAATVDANFTPGTDDESILYLATIKKAGRDLISIINNMITLNRWADIATKDRSYETHTLYDLEMRLWTETQKADLGDPRHTVSIVFTHDLPPDQYSIQTDLDLLCDSLLPLIYNAIQNTPVGKVVISISARPDSKELIVDVQDTGKGILPEDQKRIFELYERVDACTTGAGLGLTLASKFAALLNGSVDLVSSEIDRGSHFRAAFHGVNVISSEAPSNGSVVAQFTNIPKCFHTIKSAAKTSSLCDHFVKFLSCYGLSPSNNIEDSLIVLDFAVNQEQVRAALSQSHPEQVIFCLVPNSQRARCADSGFQNLIYVNGPFITPTMTEALQDAERYLANVKANRACSMQPKDDSAPRAEISGFPERGPDERHAIQVRIEDYRATNESLPSKGALRTDQSATAHPHLQDEVPVDNAAGPDAKQPATTLLQLEMVQPSSLPMKYPPSDIESSDAPPAVVEPDDIHLPHRQPTHTVPIFPSPVATSHPTALLVDDNAINLRIMRMYCEKRSLPYVCARDGLEAISFFQARQISASTGKTTSPIQLIFMDLQMPRCDGVEATRRIRILEKENGWGESTLFVVTGQDSPADRNAVEALGIQGYFVKPVALKSWDASLREHFPLFTAG